MEKEMSVWNRKKSKKLSRKANMRDDVEGGAKEKKKKRSENWTGVEG